MINHLKYINNVGRFETVALKESLPLGLLTLVFSENGRGKTTLCSILRSLTIGEAAPILERKRLSAKADAHVVITVDGSDVSFDGTAWKAAGPRIMVFDDHFVDGMRQSNPPCPQTETLLLTHAPGVLAATS